MILETNVDTPAPNNPNFGNPQCPNINNQFNPIFNTFENNRIHMEILVFPIPSRYCLQA